MRIAIDLDGVVANFVRAIDGLPANYEPPDWDFSDVFSREDWSKVWTRIKATENFWEKLSVYPENTTALRNFLTDESGHEIYYLTSRAKTVGRAVSLQTDNWLYHNALWSRRNFSAVIAVSNAAFKKDILASLEIEAFVDDYGPTVEECSSIENCKTYLLDRPWNRDKNYGKRIFTLDQFFNIITNKKPADYYLV